MSLVILPSDECHWTLLMISQHWFRWWLDAVRQQAITWTNVDVDPWCHIASIGNNELNLCILYMYNMSHIFTHGYLVHCSTLVKFPMLVHTWDIFIYSYSSPHWYFIDIYFFKNGFIRADSWLAPNQWEMASLCNDVSDWLGVSLESALFIYW